jgi:transposase
MKPHSINTMAAVFGVDRGSVYGWIRRGCPCQPAEGPGRPAHMNFAKVLRWRMGELEGQGYYTGDSLAMEETRIRARFQALTTRRP